MSGVLNLYPREGPNSRPCGAPQPGQNPRTLTTERDQALLVAGLTAYPQKTMFQSAALQVVFEFPLNVVRKCPAFLGHLPPEIRVVLRHQMIEERLFGPMALIVESSVVRTGIPCRANGGHASLPCDSE